MATDATGTPTSPDSIPTYNTSVDAPSGLGFNAAMAAIQTALSARMKAPVTPADGDVPVWDSASSTWKSNATGKKMAVGGLATGTNGQVLGTVSGASAWVGGMQKIDEKILGVAGTINFASIPSTFRHLKIFWQGFANAAVGDGAALLQFNTDTGTNYRYQTIEASSSTPAAAATSGASAGSFGAAKNPTDGNSIGEVTIENYAGTSFFKGWTATWAALGGTDLSGVTTGRWSSVSAINRIDIFTSNGSSGQFGAGAVFSLYGLS